MYDTTFDLIASGMSYWFVALIVYILVRLIRSIMKEFSQERLVRQHTEGFSVGMLEVIEPHDNTKLLGKRFALKRENRIGKARKCDVCLKDKSVSAVHAIIYQKGQNILLANYNAKHRVTVNGHAINTIVPLMDGDEIGISDVLLYLRLQGAQFRTRDDEPDPRFEDDDDEQYSAEFIGEEDESDDWDDDFDEDDEYDDSEEEIDDDYKQKNFWQRGRR